MDSTIHIPNTKQKYLWMDGVLVFCVGSGFSIFDNHGSSSFSVHMQNSFFITCKNAKQK